MGLTKFIKVKVKIRNLEGKKNPTINLDPPFSMGPGYSTTACHERPRIKFIILLPPCSGMWALHAATQLRNGASVSPSRNDVTGADLFGKGVSKS